MKNILLGVLNSVSQWCQQEPSTVPSSCHAVHGSMKPSLALYILSL